MHSHESSSHSVARSVASQRCRERSQRTTNAHAQRSPTDADYSLQSVVAHASIRGTSVGSCARMALKSLPLSSCVCVSVCADCRGTEGELRAARKASELNVDARRPLVEASSARPTPSRAFHACQKQTRPLPAPNNQLTHYHSHSHSNARNTSAAQTQTRND